MKRKIEIDILKGFLIIFVVIGHIQAYHDQPHEVIFWFHMPAFFMVSGYFMHAPKSAPWHDRAYLSKQIRRYVVPFFAWCVVGYALVRHESLLKNIVRVLYAGHNNITPYSYPYWFINALFTGSIALACIQYKLTFGGGKRWLTIIPFAILWGIVQWILPPAFPLPWSIDQGCGAVVYMAIGIAFHEYRQQRWHIFLAFLLCALFLWWQVYNGITYRLNMSSMIYNHPLLDLMIPCLFTLVLYYVSIWLAHIPILSNTLAYIGTCSITIFFTHAYILHVAHNHLTAWTSVAVAIACGTALHYILSSNRVTRRLFLGKK